MYIECTPVSCGVDYIHEFGWTESPEATYAEFVGEYKKLQDNVSNRRQRPTKVPKERDDWRMSY